jgi:WD40 repeat protein
MYVTLSAPPKRELWVSNIDGSSKVKISTGENLRTATWAQDNFHLSFVEFGATAGDKVYIVGADGSGLRQLPLTGEDVWSSVWSPDQKSIYVAGQEKGGKPIFIWEWSVDASNPQRFLDNCAMVTDADPSGQYLLGTLSSGDNRGIYEVSISDRKCISLVPSVVTETATFARDGKSFLYAVASRGEVTIYRQAWTKGKISGEPKVALKVPFTFPLWYYGNAYDFSRDLSTIVYARPGGHADLYLLSQK